VGLPGIGNGNGTGTGIEAESTEMLAGHKQRAPFLFMAAATNTSVLRRGRARVICSFRMLEKPLRCAGLGDV